MRKIIVGCMILAGSWMMACHSGNDKKAPEVAQPGDTSKYYPLTQFFKEQREYVDLRNFSIYRIHNNNDKRDSSIITKDDFLVLSSAFLVQAAMFGQQKYLFKETVFHDLSTKSYTLNYTPIDQRKTEIQNIDVLLDDENNMVSRIFIKRVYMAGDTTVTEQYNWKDRKNFLVTAFKTVGADYKSTTINYVNWAGNSSN